MTIIVNFSFIKHSSLFGVKSKRGPAVITLSEMFVYPNEANMGFTTSTLFKSSK